MHVVSIESGAGESGGHFDLSVHALFAQDGDFGFRAAVDERRGDVFVHVELHVGKQCAAVVVVNQGKLTVGAGRVVAQTLNGVAGFLPCALQVGKGLIENFFSCIDDHMAAVGKLSQIVQREIQFLAQIENIFVVGSVNSNNGS